MAARVGGRGSVTLTCPDTLGQLALVFGGAPDIWVKGWYWDWPFTGRARSDQYTVWTISVTLQYI